MQTYLYTSRFPHDPRYLKAIVRRRFSRCIYAPCSRTCTRCMLRCCVRAGRCALVSLPCQPSPSPVAICLLYPRRTCHPRATPNPTPTSRTPLSGLMLTPPPSRAASVPSLPHCPQCAGYRTCRAQLARDLPLPCFALRRPRSACRLCLVSARLTRRWQLCAHVVWPFQEL